MSFVLSTLQQSWLQEIQVATPFLAPYRETFKEVEVEKAKSVAKKELKTLLKKSTPAVVNVPIKTPVGVVKKQLRTAPVNTADLTHMSLMQLQAHVEQCQGCELHQQRTQTVWGAGQIQQPDWFVISTAPSSHEELAGLPMQGKSGELFAAQMQSIGLSVEQNVYLTQLLKCRVSSGGSAKPSLEYLEACNVILLRQIELIQPQRLLLLGSKAAAMFLGAGQSFEALRGQVQSWQDTQGRTLSVVVSYHPASLLLRPQLKAEAWHDLLLMQQAMQ